VRRVALRKRVVMARVIKRGEGDERAFDREFWQRVGHEGRFAASWDMVAEYDILRGNDAGQSRLQRSVVRLERREG
jgi:hypothetical protein